MSSELFQPGEWELLVSCPLCDWVHRQTKIGIWGEYLQNMGRIYLRDHLNTKHDLYTAYVKVTHVREDLPDA